MADAAGVAPAHGGAMDAGAGAARDAAPADLVLTHAKLHLAGDADALALRGARIVAVGKTADLERLVGPSTKVRDVAGRSVVVALTDAHTHLLKLGLVMEQVELRGCASAVECAGRVAARAKATTTPWILGAGWDQNLFPTKAFPDHEALDALESKRPVWLRRVDGHAAWANAAALRAAGITARTADPKGGRIVRDARGEPTGILVDAAMELVDKVVPPLDEATRERAILTAQAFALARGLTEVHEMGLDEAALATYRRLAAAGKLDLRVYAYAAGGDDAQRARVLDGKPDAPTEDAFFRVGGMKLYADGALGSRGAALLEPYADEPSQRGLVLTEASALEATAKKALERGFQLAVHAIGDRANRTVLDAFERAGCGAKPNHRFRIEHAQILAPSDVPRFAKLGVLASMQPTHATSDMAWVPARLGPSRVDGAYAWRSLKESGAHVVAGSDFPVEEVEPTFGFYAFVTRQDQAGNPDGGWLAKQKLTLDEALAAFTSEAAYAAFEERWRGAPAPGFAADVTVFDRALASTDPKALRGAAVDLTIVGGRVRFERSASR